jgi:hypothetical protein
MVPAFLITPVPPGGPNEISAAVHFERGLQFVASMWFREGKTDNTNFVVRQVLKCDPIYFKF